MYDSGASLLPTGKTINPSDPTDAYYYHAEQICYVVADIVNVKKLRALTSFGGFGNGWALGTVHSIRHDQTWRNLGTYKVIGIASFEDGSIVGEVPAKKIPHWVFK